MIRNKHVLKTAGLLFSTFVLLFYTFSFPIVSLANTEEIVIDPIVGKITVDVDSDETLDEVPVYEEDDVESDVIDYLENDDTVVVLETFESMSLVEIPSTKEDDINSEEVPDNELDEISQELLVGYVMNEHIEIIDEDEDSETEETEEDIGVENDNENESSDESDAVDESGEVIEPTDNEELTENENFDQSDVPVIEAKDEVENTQPQMNQALSTASKGELFSGVALKNKTHVYSKQSRVSSVLKSYSQGMVLKYRSLNNNWYSATVYIKGKATAGFIHTSDVEHLVEDVQSLNGIALNSPTHVYSNVSTDSKALKSYPKGSVLKFSSLTNNWYKTGVFVDGKKQTGYIHKSHVERAVTEADKVSLQGIALKSPTHVYSGTSTSSKSLKSYNQGTVLRYSTFSKDWYQTGVYINGKKQTGYIHKSHVETAVTEADKVSLQGIGLKSPTHVYSGTSTSSKSLKSYNQGTVLRYSTFSKDWYQTGVYINGKKQIGYIHKSHVETAVTEADKVSLQGIGLKSPTHVYSGASTSSKSLKSYNQGTVLRFSTFSKDWYQTGVYINGKKQIGYIHKSHVEDINLDYELVTKYANKNSINIYQTPSTTSNVVKKYKLNSKLTIRTFSNNWFQARIKVGNEYMLGYINKNDVSDQIIDDSKQSKYNYTFKKLVDDQFKRDTAPNKDGGGSVISTRGEVEFFTNPNHFLKGTTGYYQFLVLNESAGLDAKELNNTILKGKGILAGQGEAFVKAGEKNNMNEAYLIAHALLETGNGTSTLAQGIWVDEFGTITRKNGKLAKTEKSKYKVYNVYGYGAKNACPLDCGAQTAFSEKWFTPEAAIIGGSNKINSGYIDNGLNTLYKMRWNPANPGHWRQYATHTKWAYLQTQRIATIYSQLTNHNSKFDIPSFQGMPDYKNGADAVITGNNVNMRSGAGTTNSIIRSLAINTSVKIYGGNIVGSEGWYQINVNGQTGWVHSDYIKLTY